MPKNKWISRCVNLAGTTALFFLFVLLFESGVLGAKIYRMGTLRYGNPISLTKALKDLKKSE